MEITGLPYRLNGIKIISIETILLLNKFNKNKNPIIIKADDSIFNEIINICDRNTDKLRYALAFDEMIIYNPREIKHISDLVS